MCNAVSLFLLQNLDTISLMPRDRHYYPRNRLATQKNRSGLCGQKENFHVGCALVHKTIMQVTCMLYTLP